MGEKKVIILNTDHFKSCFAKWGDFADMAIKMFEASRFDLPPVEYKVFCICENDFPSLEDLVSSEVLGVYITGSAYDSFSNEVEWIIKFRQFIAQFLAIENHPPLVGVCFGHQIIAKSLGCDVGRNPDGFEGGITPITLASEAIELGLFQEDADVMRTTLQLSETHSDIVNEIPQGYTNIGSTAKCSIQGLYCPKKVLTLQGHPEFETDVTRICANLQLEKGNVTSEENKDMQNRCTSLSNEGLLVANSLWKLFYGAI
ncbi:LAMI_0H16820g1_1 [Lachancea mirantina]|uniref:LAMI_0H16820g1_1 n=1 Tax=Lachancea mirantina TaxID=1230905 RepID=A0A1G4KJH1_9SACH|nr:LAMI_0H16820g1_1 [Lachancea mirantina]